jgi:hypothetical protein
MYASCVRGIATLRASLIAPVLDLVHAREAREDRQSRGVRRRMAVRTQGVRAQVERRRAVDAPAVVPLRHGVERPKLLLGARWPTSASMRVVPTPISAPTTAAGALGVAGGEVGMLQAPDDTVGALVNGQQRQ